MRIKGLFGILTFLLLLLLTLFSWLVTQGESSGLFFVLEGVILLVAVYLIFFYRKVMKPLQVIGDGMELLREQDFSSRLRHVGQKETDRIIDIFNEMMERLKNERLNLREQNHLLDLLIDASPLGVIMLDLDEHILSFNPAACKLFGISEQKYKGRRLNDLGIPLAEELSRIPVYKSHTIRLSDANIYKCIHSSFVDKGFHHSFYLLESLTEEVFKAEKRAYEKVIRMIAHEVNNTTAGITSTLDTLENAFSVQQEMEDICNVLQVAIERCYGMSRFITRFADVVRIPDPQFQLVELNGLVISSKQFMETLCINRAIDLNLQTCERDLFVKLDPVLFEQVLVNIIKNAVESIGEKGNITLTVSANPVSLIITDTGTGIDKETETKLFTPFFSTKPNGQGIGLVFIREVLQQHACSFSLRTEEDNLTRFRILFNSY